MDDEARVAAVEDVPADSSRLFTVREVDSGDRKEVMLVRVGEGGPDGDGSDGNGSDDGTDPEVAAWLNYCQHFRHIRLDKGSGVEYRGEEVVCTNHGAMFDAESGLCTFGPCEGAYLDPVEVTVEGGAVYLTDGDYEFESDGPEERDPVNLGSKSNVEF